MLRTDCPGGDMMKGGCVAVDLSAGPSPGEWAVMGRGGVVHIAETDDGLPRGRSLCGAVGTVFVVSSPLRRSARVCESCIELARADSDPDLR